MKQIHILLLSVFAIILLSGCTTNQKIEPKTKEYYEDFRKKCEGSQCCLDSVYSAEQDKSFIYSKENTFTDFECPNGFQHSANKCPDSYKWCSPITKDDRSLRDILHSQQTASPTVMRLKGVFPIPYPKKIA